MQLMTEWIAIEEYRDFWHVPRMFVINVDGRIILFDCPFDDELEDYTDEYTIYDLGERSLDTLPGVWLGLSRLAVGCKGKVAVRKVTFDHTKRKQIDRTVLTDLLT